MGVQTSNTDRLDKLLSPHKQSIDVLKEALEEVSKEQAEGRKKRAKELIVKCLELQDQMNAAERRFTGEKKKCDKQLGKLLNQLNNMANGKPLDQGNEEEDDEEEATDESGGDDTPAE